MGLKQLVTVLISIACGWANAQTLQLVRTIPLPNVEGRIDHMSLCGDRLYIGAVGNNSLEVVDLKAGKWLQSIGDLPEAQGVRCSDALGRLFVGTGGDGACHIFDSQSLKPVKTVKLGDDADNVRIDEKANQIFVGYGEGAIAVIDAMTGERINNIKLPGHPESFQLERNGNRIFVNVPSAEEVAVIDRARGQVTANWRVTEAKANFPMALDEVHGRLLIVCRKPARLIVKDTTSGKTVATLDCCGDADDIFYDDKSKQIFISGGDGHIDVIIQKDLDHYDRPATISTAVGARTSLWSPEKRQPSPIAEISARRSACMS